MGVQLEPVSQGSFEQYGPWHFRDTRFQRSQSVELGTAFLRAAALPALNDLCEASKTRRANDLPQDSADKSSTRKRSRSGSRDLPASLPTSTITAPLTTTLKEFLIETQSLPPSLEPIAVKFVPLVEKVVLTFPLPLLPVRPRPDLKRRRRDTDVDGFNTAGLSSKKRRLRRHLITSRLSQPFSLPATHILNREVVASGDKRFLKLAAIMATRRLQPQPLPPPLTDPSSLLRRQAVFNRYRLRMCAEAAARGIPQGATMGLRAPVPYQPSHGMGMFPMGSSRHLPPVAGTGPSNPQAQEPAKPAAATQPSAGSLIPSPAPVPATSRLRIPSPRLRPLRSPELRVTRPAVALDDLEDLDDDDVAFPTSEHESRYEDEPDDVYADFGVIFGGGNGDGSDDEGGAEQFEDYMDDLDGIPWNARC